MARTIQDLGLAADVSQDAGDYLCNFTLYRLLAQVPMTAFLHVPPVSEAAALDDIVKAVQAAASALAKSLPSNRHRPA